MDGELPVGAMCGGPWLGGGVAILPESFMIATQGRAQGAAYHRGLFTLEPFHHFHRLVILTGGLAATFLWSVCSTVGIA